MNTPRSFLVIKLRALGDTVLLTASLGELKRLFPDAAIDVVVTDWWAPVLKNHPAVRRLYTVPAARGGWRTVARFFKIIALTFHLRKVHYDWVLGFHASPSSAILARLSGSRNRAIHFHGHNRPNRYSTVEIPGKGTLKPIIERDLDVLRAVCFSLNQPEPRATVIPEVTLSEQERERGREYLRSKGLVSPVLVLGLGASRPAKMWPLEKFSELAQLWHKQTGGGVLALGGPGEKRLGRIFRTLLGRRSQTKPIEFVCDLDIRSAAAVLAGCSVFCGNDSGPKHLAVAVSTPTCTVFGPEDPFEWHPYPVDLHPYYFVEGLSCRKDAHPGMPPWCGCYRCKQGQECMLRVSVKEVFETCQKISASR